MLELLELVPASMGGGDAAALSPTDLAAPSGDSFSGECASWCCLYYWCMLTIPSPSLSPHSGGAVAARMP